LFSALKRPYSAAVCSVVGGDWPCVSAEAKPCLPPGSAIAEAGVKVGFAGVAAPSAPPAQIAAQVAALDVRRLSSFCFKTPRGDSPIARPTWLAQPSIGPMMSDSAGQSLARQAPGGFDVTASPGSRVALVADPSGASESPSRSASDRSNLKFSSGTYSSIDAPFDSTANPRTVPTK
jgi:hypothetical protein